MICEGSSYNFYGKILDSSGTYTQSLKNAYGCDSIDVLILTIISSDTTFINKTIYDGESYNFGGNELTTTGIYTKNYINKFGCDSLVELFLTVKYDIELPEIFTPNNDGSNDYFVIKNLDKYPNNKILIFNRWGNKVWEEGPYLNDWNGTNKFGIAVGGNKLPVGTYFYVLDLGDGSAVKKGFVYLNW
jgi:gliding motility-associated-like protein